jgi:hypothetical protein
MVHEVIDSKPFAYFKFVLTLQGLAWLATSRTIGDREVDVVVAGAIKTLSYGLKPRRSSASRTHRRRDVASTEPVRRVANDGPRTAKRGGRQT